MKDKNKKRINEISKEYSNKNKEMIIELIKTIEKEFDKNDLNPVYNIILTDIIIKSMNTIAQQGEPTKKALKGFVDKFFDDGKKDVNYIG